jgi:hypothetical protein
VPMPCRCGGRPVAPAQATVLLCLLEPGPSAFRPTGRQLLMCSPKGAVQRNMADAAVPARGSSKGGADPSPPRHPTQGIRVSLLEGVHAVFSGGLITSPSSELWRMAESCGALHLLPAGSVGGGTRAATVAHARARNCRHGRRRLFACLGTNLCFHLAQSVASRVPPSAAVPA